MAKQNNKADEAGKKQVLPIQDGNKEGDQTTQTQSTLNENDEGDQTTTTTPATSVDKFTAKCQEVAARYAESYPSSKVFHFCSDMQVFLSNGLSAAKNHQQTLAEGDVVTINIE